MFDSEIAAASAQYGVDPSWIQAVIQTESNWNPNAHNLNDPGTAYGLMQILPTTARGLGYQGDLNGLFDPETNINLGTKLLGQLKQAYGDDFRRVYSAYNSGNPDLWETSAQVAAHVATALNNLAQWATGEGSGAVVVMLLALGAWWLWKNFE